MSSEGTPPMKDGARGLTKAQHELVEEAMWAAKRLAQQVKRTSMTTLKDLVAIGYLQLCEHAPTFDPSKSASLATYAWKAMYHAMVRSDKPAGWRGWEGRGTACDFLSGLCEEDGERDESYDAERRRIDDLCHGTVIATASELAANAQRAPGDEGVVQRKSYAYAMWALETSRSTLVAREATVIDMRHREEPLEFEAIAHALGKNERTVRRWYTQAFKHLSARVRALGVPESPPLEGRPEVPKGDGLPSW
jgi:RNA polymerase sigma factor (sigma-70 family)